MPQSELIIVNPPENDDPHHRYTEKDDFRLLNNLQRLVRERLSTQPNLRAIELFAGNGPVAKMLIELGIPPTSVTCVDKAESGFKLTEARDAQWNYWDLDVLAQTLIADEELPPELVAHKNQYDLVTAHFPVNAFSTIWENERKKRLEVLISFFSKPDAIVDII